MRDSLGDCIKAMQDGHVQCTLEKSVISIMAQHVNPLPEKLAFQVSMSIPAAPLSIQNRTTVPGEKMEDAPKCLGLCMYVGDLDAGS